MTAHSILLMLIFFSFLHIESAKMDLLSVVPLSHAHAHNDYLHPVPLYGALAHGFTSVEVDICLEDGKLLVAHDRKDARGQRKLQALYLDPLKKIIQSNGGVVFQDGVQLTLLIDIKSKATSTYQVLHKVLSKYQDILTIYEQGTVINGPVKVVISGHRPHKYMAKQKIRFATMDGRLSDLKRPQPPHLIELVSDKWTKIFDWRGVGAFSPGEKSKLQKIVKLAHAQGRRLRFWATPESPSAAKMAVWTELLDAGVDLVNTNDLDGFERFLLNFDKLKETGRPGPMTTLNSRGQTRSPAFENKGYRQ